MRPLRAELDGLLGLPPRDWGAAAARRAVVPSDPRMLRDRQILRRGGLTIDVLATPGHTDGHLCFYDADRKLLFTGDHVLPHISPNVSVPPVDPPSDPLGDYFHSLRRVAEVSAEHVLPGHEYVFNDVAGRAAELIEHHVERSAEIRSTVSRAPGTSVAELVPQLTWSRGFDEMDSAAISAAAG